MKKMIHRFLKRRELRRRYREACEMIEFGGADLRAQGARMIQEIAKELEGV